MVSLPLNNLDDPSRANYENGQIWMLILSVKFLHNIASLLRNAIKFIRGSMWIPFRVEFKRTLQLPRFILNFDLNIGLGQICLQSALYELCANTVLFHIQLGIVEMPTSEIPLFMLEVKRIFRSINEISFVFASRSN